MPVVLALIAAGCSGAGSPTAPSEASAPAYKLSGRVVDANLNTAIQGVTLSPADGANTGKSATTSWDGRYALANLTPGTFTLRVQRDGYEDLHQQISMTSDTVIDMRLTPKRVINSDWAGGQLYARADGQDIGARITSVSVTQAGTALSGVFTTADGGSGSFTGQLAGAHFTGTMHLELVFGTPVKRCRGTARNTSGTATPNNIALSAIAVSLESCSNAITNVQLTITP